MKKYFIILCLGISMMFVTSCRWIHESFYSVEACAEWYCEELYEAAADEDKKKFIERYDQMMQWMDDLSRSKTEKAEEAVEEWTEKNELKENCIDRYYERIY